MENERIYGRSDYNLTDTDFMSRPANLRLLMDTVNALTLLAHHEGEACEALIRGLSFVTDISGQRQLLSLHETVT